MRLDSILLEPELLYLSGWVLTTYTYNVNTSDSVQGLRMSVYQLKVKGYILHLPREEKREKICELEKIE